MSVCRPHPRVRFLRQEEEARGNSLEAGAADPRSAPQTRTRPPLGALQALAPGDSCCWNSGGGQTPRVLCWGRDPEQSLLVHPRLFATPTSLKRWAEVQPTPCSQDCRHGSLRERLPRAAHRPVCSASAPGLKRQTPSLPEASSATEMWRDRPPRGAKSYAALP